MNVIKRSSCRVCGSSSIHTVIDLGEQMIQGAFHKEGVSHPSRRKIPCQLVRCSPDLDEKACGLLQLGHTVPQKALYSTYWYRSGTNETMRSHLGGLAEQCIGMSSDPGPKSVLDIGCNDGTLLNFFPDSWMRMGIDPSNAFLINDLNSKITFVRDVFPVKKNDLAGLKFDVVTSIAMFYDLEDPVLFAKRVRDVLKTDGIWVIEVSYMPKMLEMNSYDTICHEHLEYYSLSSIEFIMNLADLRVLRVEMNQINGGSIRVFVCHKRSHITNDEWESGVDSVRNSEFDSQLDADSPYLEFSNRIHSNREHLVSMIEEIVASGKTIHVYGASTKGNTILQYCGITKELIPFASDRNPDKAGSVCIGSDILVIPEEESRRMKPDFYLVLPWHFRDEFIKRESDMIRDGCRFIFPMPTPHIFP